MKKHFMLDIETTGVDIAADDILQIAILEATWNGDYWEAGNRFERFVHSTKKPENAFAKAHMEGIYAIANRQPECDSAVIRADILQFFRRCGETPPDIFMMGKNVGSFDLPFMVAKEFLKPSGYAADSIGQEHRTGDFHYRSYDVTSARAVTANILRCDLSRVKERMQLYKTPNPIQSKAHDALWDCYDQLDELNALIRLVHSER